MLGRRDRAAGVRRRAPQAPQRAPGAPEPGEAHQVEEKFKGMRRVVKPREDPEPQALGGFFAVGVPPVSCVDS